MKRLADGIRSANHAYAIYVALPYQQHLASLYYPITEQTRQIQSAGQSSTITIPPVPDRFVITRCLYGIYQGDYLLATERIYCQLYGLLPLNVISQYRGPIKWVRRVLMQMRTDWPLFFLTLTYDGV